MESAGYDPTVAGPAFMASLDALVAASATGGGAIDEDALRYCLETLDGRIAELKVRARVGAPCAVCGRHGMGYVLCGLCTSSVAWLVTCDHAPGDG